MYEIIKSMNRLNKKIFFFLFSIILMFSLIACTQPVSEPASSAFQEDFEITPLSDVQIEEKRQQVSSIPEIEQNKVSEEHPSGIVESSTSSPIENSSESEQIGEIQFNLINYETQSGDTLFAISKHFNVLQDEIRSHEPIPDSDFIQPGQLLIIPDRVEEAGSNKQLMPDSEVIYSMTSANFSIGGFIKEADGYLNKYTELLGNGWHTGSELVFNVASDFSISPRLLLAILEHQSHWVYQKPTTYEDAIYPIGYIEEYEELFAQLSWAAQQLNVGYYKWRDGTLTDLDFPDGGHLRLAPDLNAGSVALLYFFSRLYNQDRCQEILYEPDGFLTLYDLMFSDPWQRDREMIEKYGPIIPGGLQQPTMELPLKVGHPWNYTGGPHAAWGTQGPWAALDFAPKGVVKCAASREYATAVAPGLIVRLGEGPVILDLDGDGFEQSGWNILYMHISFRDRVAAGTYVETNDYIGHPSCYGGRSTGTHLHIARKYNGEWIIADGPVPFVMSGWQAEAGNTSYTGRLIKGNQEIISSDFSGSESLIVRE